MNGSRLMVRSGLTAGVIAIVAEGCVGKVASNNEASTVHRAPDGNHGSAGFTEIAPGLPALDEAGPAVVSAVSPADDAGLSVSPGSPPAEAGSSACPNPDPVANPGEAGIGDELSYRRVTFRVTNTGAKDVYLSGLGRGCTDYSIDGIDGCPVPLLVW
ncbi:MAG: hypothetical protein M3O46_07550, partial [Myxococcota bacterium]|nr:hypothetical protein [Myxococcota bacterium]